MGVLREAIANAGRDQTPAAAPPAPPAGPDLDRTHELRRRRDALAEHVAELHWDLGGLTYEMAIRDHFRLDVLLRRAAILQERDAELAELELLLRTEQQRAGASCPRCATTHTPGATYCSQCGTALRDSAAAAADAAAGADHRRAADPGPAADGLAVDHRFLTDHSHGEPPAPAGG